MLDHPNTMSSFWMPFSANRDFLREPRMIQSAEGMYYTSSEGMQVMDATAGLWCVNAGHRDPLIVDAVQKQVHELDYAPNFQFAHPKAFELSAKPTNCCFGGEDDMTLFITARSSLFSVKTKVGGAR